MRATPALTGFTCWILGDAEPEVRRIRPQEGRLVLFPSFVYHETVPFESQAHRISIAFDAVPRW